MHIDIHEAARRAIAEASRPLRAKRTPDNVIAAGGRKIRPQTHKQPVQPNGGEPGRPWRRQLARALYEDQQRKTRTPQRELVEADIASSKRTLPKATKLDRGSLAGGIGRHTQRVTGRMPLVKFFWRRARLFG